MLQYLPLLLLFSTGVQTDGIISQTSSEFVMTQAKNKVSKRPHPAPFARFLKNNQERNELSRLIKEARSAGAPKQEVSRRIDVFLRTHLDDEDIKEVERLQNEGIKLNARFNITHK